jgi:alkylation response protein AidB-like acyl-CoA dehydrogenase
MESNSSDTEKAKKLSGFAEILTPLVKCYGSEASLGVIAEAIQVLGGVDIRRSILWSSNLRDSKILTIWKGRPLSMPTISLVGRCG